MIRSKAKLGYFSEDRNGRIAQLVEQLTLNQRVLGSNPSASTIGIIMVLTCNRRAIEQSRIWQQPLGRSGAHWDCRSASLAQQRSRATSAVAYDQKRPDRFSPLRNRNEFKRNRSVTDFRDPSHDHVFGVDKKRPGESRTAIVVGITAVMMVIEIAAGIAFGSMALLADGLHMASHAVALTVTLFAYVLARRWASSPRYSFGAGKLNPLGAFASAVLLAGFAALMAIESFQRFLNPVTIQFDQAIWVAVVGLLVNGVCALLLTHDPSHDHGHDHGHHHHRDANGHDHDHPHEHDHNLRAAYFHVLADALTSLLAIFALLAGKYFNAGWLDPMMGIVGAVLVARWSWGLLKQTGNVLMDAQADKEMLEEVKSDIEQKTGAKVADLHVWEVAPGARAAAITVVSDNAITAQACRDALPRSANILHSTIEVVSGP